MGTEGGGVVTEWGGMGREGGGGGRRGGRGEEEGETPWLKRPTDGQRTHCERQSQPTVGEDGQVRATPAVRTTGWHGSGAVAGGGDARGKLGGMRQAMGCGGVMRRRGGGWGRGGGADPPENAALPWSATAPTGCGGRGGPNKSSNVLDDLRGVAEPVRLGAARVDRGANRRAAARRGRRQLTTPWAPPPTNRVTPRGDGGASRPTRSCEAGGGAGGEGGRLSSHRLALYAYPCGDPTGCAMAYFHSPFTALLFKP